jgi:hypothetical protein
LVIFKIGKKYTKILYCIYGDSEEEFSSIYNEFILCQDSLRLDLNKVILSTSYCDLTNWKSKFNAENEIIDLCNINKSCKDIRFILEDSFKGTPKIQSPKLSLKYEKMEHHLEEIFKLSK